MEGLRVLGAILVARVIDAAAGLMGLIVALAAAPWSGAAAVLGLSVSALGGSVCASLLIGWSALPPRDEGEAAGPPGLAWIAAPIAFLLATAVEAISRSFGWQALYTRGSIEDLSQWMTLYQVTATLGLGLESLAMVLAFGLLFNRASATSAPRR